MHTNEFTLKGEKNSTDQKDKACYDRSTEEQHQKTQKHDKATTHHNSAKPNGFVVTGVIQSTQTSTFGIKLQYNIQIPVLSTFQLLKMLTKKRKTLKTLKRGFNIQESTFKSIK